MGEAIRGRRDDVFLVSKVLPTNAGAAATIRACEGSLRRGIEWDLLPWCADRGLPIMAYSPIEQGRLLEHSTVWAVAARRRRPL